MEKRLRERFITRLIRMSGYSAILFVALIFFFLLRSGLPAVFEIPLDNFFSSRWYVNSISNVERGAINRIDIKAMARMISPFCTPVTTINGASVACTVALPRVNSR